MSLQLVNSLSPSPSMIQPATPSTGNCGGLFWPWESPDLKAGTSLSISGPDMKRRSYGQAGRTSQRLLSWKERDDRSLKKAHKQSTLKPSSNKRWKGAEKQSTSSKKRRRHDGHIHGEACSSYSPQPGARRSLSEDNTMPNTTKRLREEERKDPDSIIPGNNNNLVLSMTEFQNCCVLF